MSVFVLTQSGENSYRALFDTAEPADDRLHRLLSLTVDLGIQPLSTTHQCHAIAGPEHPHFEAALAAYGLDWLKPCDQNIVTRTMELLVASEMFEPTAINDECVRGMLASGFDTEDDWERRGAICESLVRTYLAAHYEGFDLDHDRMDADHISAYSALTGGMVVALTVARAEWTV